MATRFLRVAWAEARPPRGLRHLVRNFSRCETILMASAARRARAPAITHLTLAPALLLWRLCCHRFSTSPEQLGPHGYTSSGSSCLSAQDAEDAVPTPLNDTMPVRMNVITPRPGPWS